MTIMALHMAYSSCVAWLLLLLVVIVMSGKYPSAESAAPSPISLSLYPLQFASIYDQLCA